MIAEKRPHCPTRGPFHSDRYDHEEGIIFYNVRNQDHDIVCKLSEMDNPNAKADADLIVRLLNNQHPD